MKLRKALLSVFLMLGLSTPVWADEDVLRTLKIIEGKQDEILARLDVIQSELDIVKIRASN